ncbi:MAG: nitroreductase family deazaflavin-dependent oxidoreductase [Anaerolineae bacterium]
MSAAQNLRQPRKLNRVRQFNKRIFNHFTMLFAGRFIYAVVEHTGRRSGKHYTTPIVAIRRDNQIIMPLPYGTDTDWCQNILAAQGCRLRLHGKVYQVTAPHIVEADMAMPLLYPYWRLMFKRFKIGHYLITQSA